MASRHREAANLLGGDYSRTGPRTGADKVSTFFYVSILISAIGAFVFGFSLGYTSPTFLAKYSGDVADAQTECVMVKDGDYTMKTCKADGGIWDSSETNAAYKCHGPNAKGMMNCELKLSDDISSWFGSLINIGCLIGAMCGGTVADKCGKKIGMMLSYFFYIGGWLLITLAPKPTGIDTPTIVHMLVASRLCIGFAIGIVCCTVSNYQTEICPTSMRGTVGTLFQVAITVGLMSAYLIGVVLQNWLVLAWIMVIASATGLLCSFVLQETPLYLNMQGRGPEAMAAQRKLRTHDSDIDTAVNQLPQGGKGGAGPASGGFGALFGGGVATKTLFIGIGLMFVQQLSGINAIMFYCGTILQSAFPPATANKVAVGIQVMQVVITVVSAPIMDKAGRVPILLFAAIGQCCACGLLGAYYLTITCDGGAGGAGSWQPDSHHSGSHSGWDEDYVFSLADTFVGVEGSAEPVRGRAPRGAKTCANLSTKKGPVSTR